MVPVRLASFALGLTTSLGLPTMPAAAMNLSGSGLTDGGQLPLAQVHAREGCTGADRSPALVWGGAPPGTQSFVVTLFDPDAPTGHGWWHWAVFDVPAGRHSLEAGSSPAGAVVGRNDFGDSAYGGACPPAGDPPHRYVFTVWALDAPRLPFDVDTADATIGAYLQAHATASATLTLRYGR